MEYIIRGVSYLLDWLKPIYSLENITPMTDKEAMEFDRKALASDWKTILGFLNFK